MTKSDFLLPIPLGVSLFRGTFLGAPPNSLLLHNGPLDTFLSSSHPLFLVHFALRQTGGRAELLGRQRVYRLLHRQLRPRIQRGTPATVPARRLPRQALGRGARSRRQPHRGSPEVRMGLAVIVLLQGSAVTLK